MLAIVQANSASLVLWDPTKIQTHQLVDLPCKDISFIKWSKAPNSLLVRPAIVSCAKRVLICSYV